MNLLVRYFSAEGLPVSVPSLPSTATVRWTEAAYPWLGGVAFGLWCGHGVPQAWGLSGGRGAGGPTRVGPAAPAANAVFN